MKKISTLIFILSALFVCSIPLYSEPQQKVLIYNFQNSTKKSSVAHYSRIIPDNLGIEIERTERYYVARNKKSSLSKGTLNSLNKLRDLAEKADADFIVAGKYSATSYSLFVTAYVYAADDEEFYTVKMPKQQIGIFLGELVDELAVKVGFEMQKHLPESSPPVISPNKARFGYYRQVTIQSGGEDDEIRYTLNGSYPTDETGRIYSEPIDIYKTTTVRAVSKGEESAVSEVVSKKYMANFPVHLFEINFLYGMGYYLAPYGDDMKSLLDTQFASVVSVFHLGGIDAVKPVPVVRNLGLGFWGDFASSPTKAGSINKMQGYSGGLFYKIRAHRHFMVQLPFTVGTMKTTTVSKDREGFDGMFFGADKDSSSSSDDLYFNTGLMFSFPINDWFEFNLAIMAKQITYSSDSANLLTVQGGMGFGF